MINRIEKVREAQNLSTRAFAIKCGLNQPTLDRMLKGINALNLNCITSILETFPNVSAEWLMRGKGEMFLSPDLSHIPLNSPITPSLNSKIREIISFYKLSDRQFAIKIGVTQSVIGSMFQKGTEPSSKVIRNTLMSFPEISSDWFLRDEGEMLKSSNKETPRIESLLETISTIQDAMNNYKDTILSLEERIKELETKFNNK